MSMNNTPALIGMICVAGGSCYLIETGQSLHISTLPQLAAASIIGGLGLLLGLLFSQAALHRAEQSLTASEHQRRQSLIARRHKEDNLHAEIDRLRAEMTAALALHDQQLLHALTNQTSEDGNGHAATSHN